MEVSKPAGFQDVTIGCKLPDDWCPVPPQIGAVQITGSGINAEEECNIITLCESIWDQKGCLTMCSTWIDSCKGFEGENGAMVGGEGI